MDKKTKRYNTLILISLVSLMTFPVYLSRAAVVSHPSPGHPLEFIRISDDGNHFVYSESGERFIAWGFNYDHDDTGCLIEDYWLDQWPTVVEDFREMKSLGANAVRIHLQTAKFMESENKVNPQAIKQLIRLVTLAEQVGLYLDITGLGCYHKQDVPRWYDALDRERRWDVQALFWESVAKTCADSPAVFCYDLMNEPILPGADKAETEWLAGEFGGKYFVQRIALDLSGQSREQLAKAWVDKLTAAIRKHDKTHLITVGIIPWALTFPNAKPLFYSEQVAKNLDFVSVHFYPQKDEVDKALAALKVYDIGKPLIIEETFPLNCSRDELDVFIDGSKEIADGFLGFYWGKTIDEYTERNAGIADVLAKSWLEYFQSKGPEILGKNKSESQLILNDDEYFEKAGLNVMVFSDFYPEGHQGGVSIIQNGVRVAANGDIRLEPTPGQWQPIPKLDKRVVDKENHTITAYLSYPDPERDRKGFNPIIYPDLKLSYQISVKPDGDSFRIIVDLNEPLGAEWVGKVGFNMELFPGEYFGKSFYMDNKVGMFPRQLNGPMYIDSDNIPQCEPLARGSKLSVAPEVTALQMTIEAMNGTLELLDGRAQHNNGWFVVRSPLPGNKTKGALEWKVTPHTIPGWLYTPVIHLSQVGYHPKQEKTAVIELDKNDKENKEFFLYKLLPSGDCEEIKKEPPQSWGNFLRYRYLKFDFSDISEPGVYLVKYGNQESNVFRIDKDIYSRHVWQPALEYFLPVQMCHMRINDRYRVWHGLCHIDDALMAPVNTNHFDGYLQGPSTLTKYEPMQPVPGLNIGGWHDAGDYDLRIESQIGTVRILSQIYEEFGVDYDATTVNQETRIVELHRPDGVPDILQQIEHGILSVVGGYKSMGRFYRGIICPTLRQYVLLGDGSTMTDNKIYDPSLKPDETQSNRSGAADDRLVFTEENPARELEVAAGLAAAARALKDYNPSLSKDCIEIAEAIYAKAGNAEGRRTASAKIEALVELYLTTGKEEYKNQLVAMRPDIVRNIERCGWALGRVMDKIDNAEFRDSFTEAVAQYRKRIEQQGNETPFGVPYRPNIWGAGWGIQSFGVPQYFLHKGWPEIFDAKYMLNALNFVLGCHPGSNTTSFVSGVGSNSLTVAYGVNRADWSYIPGGVGSGTALIRPDFPELKTWPFFWQQSEYVVGGGGSNFMFLALAANQILNEQ